MTPLRNWWKEDPEKTQRYYNHVLQRIGEAPDECTAEIVAQIISNHLKTRSMLTIIPLPDWFAMDDSIKRKDIESERINVPANSTHYWRYRMHITLEQLLQADNLNNKIVSLIKRGWTKIRKTKGRIESAALSLFVRFLFSGTHRAGSVEPCVWFDL